VNSRNGTSVIVKARPTTQVTTGTVRERRRAERLGADEREHPAGDGEGGNRGIEDVL